MLTVAELAALRRDALATLTDRCDIERSTTVQNGLDRSKSWAVVATQVPCRIVEQGEGRGNRTEVIAGQTGAIGNHLVRLPYAVPVNRGDRLRISLDRERLFTVEEVFSRTNATVTTVLCTESS